MISVEKSIHINKPIADVFAFMSEFSNDAKWQGDLVRSEKTSDGPMAVGSTGLYVQKVMGKEIKNDVVVTGYEPPKRFSVKTTSGPVQFEFVTSFEGMGGGTHVTANLKGEAGGFFKVAEGLLQKEIAKSFERDFAKLKELLEA
ncbi:MAG: SRPBCC family protein [Chloroflexota bacterium]